MRALLADKVAVHEPAQTRTQNVGYRCLGGRQHARRRCAVSQPVHVPLATRLGRGQFDHTLLQPQPIWMALLTDGFNPFGASGAFLTGLGLALWASRSLSITVNVGWLALCVCNLLASATTVMLT